MWKTIKRELQYLVKYLFQDELQLYYIIEKFKHSFLRVRKSILHVVNI